MRSSNLEIVSIRGMAMIYDTAAFASQDMERTSFHDARHFPWIQVVTFNEW